MVASRIPREEESEAAQHEDNGLHQVAAAVDRARVIGQLLICSPHAEYLFCTSLYVSTSVPANFA